ncbi:MAG: hypothetical protein KDC84_01105 [Crocinitomicaceae bacterium]|nr:hypothetical protein [Crocinitomicaceae bacterium]
MLNTVYQTLKDKGNPEVIEENGPIKCTSEDAWLGDGYYLWHGFEPLAHWWGKYRLRMPYMVGTAKINFYEECSCYDLHANFNHIEDFWGVKTEWEKQLKKLATMKGKPYKEPTIAKIINFMKSKDIFKYDSIRINGVNSMHENNEYSRKVKVSEKDCDEHKHVDALPQIQICMYKIDALDFREFRIIYPPSHVTRGAF